MKLNIFTKLKQTRLKTETQRGNCLPTVIACLLGYDNPESVIQIQEYYDSDDWLDIMYDWLYKKGFEREWINGHLYNDELYMVSGNTVRNILHVCIYKNGKLYHDPHPANTGLITETTFSILIPVNNKP